jgi:hypothetical protein
VLHYGVVYFFFVFFFFHCEIAGALWSAIFSVVALTWIMPRRVVGFFACWRGLSGSPHSAPVWKMVPLCFLWYIWRERNYRSFEDHERMVVDLSFSSSILFSTE